MKKITLLFILSFFCLTANAQFLTENFDAPTIPSGWSNEYVSDVVNWRFVGTNQNSSIVPRNGSGMAAFWSENYNSDATKLVSPSMDLSSLPAQVLTFYHTQVNWDSDQDQLRVYYKTSTAGSWVLLATYLSPVLNWTEVNLSLPNPSADYYIAFEATSKYGRGVTIDDVEIADAPTCLIPGNLNVTPTSITETTLNWTPTGTETDFTYEYGNNGFTQGGAGSLGSGSVSGNNFAISGLTGGNTYQFYVQANCGVEGDSGFAGPFTWTQPDSGDSCVTAIVASIEADCGTATPISLDFTGAPSNIATSCGTFENYGLWVTTTTDSEGGLTVNASASVKMAVFSACGGTEIKCFGSDFSPALDVVLSPNTPYYLYFWQEGNGSTAMVDVCLSSFTPAPAPNCTEAPISPANDATDVPVGTVSLSWTAPSSGPAPTSYNVYAGSTSGALTFITNVLAPTTTLNVNVTDYSELYYWSVVAVNESTEATSCAEWNFTTENSPPPPANDDCGNATTLVQQTNVSDAASATANSATIAFATDSGVADPVCEGFAGVPNDDVWFKFVALTSDVNITLYDTFDGVVELFSGSCGSLNSLSCADTSANPQINATSLIVDDTYYVRVFNASDTPTATPNFNLKLWTSSVLSDNQIENENAFSFYPNPVNDELSLRAQSNIKNVAIYNMLGQEVLRTAPNTLESRVNMSELKTGTYFVQVNINDVIKTIRIIKK